MLDKIIRELTSRTGNVLMTSEDELVWAKRVEAQRVQAVVLNDLTEIRAFNKIKKETEPKSTRGREAQVATHKRWPCRYCGEAMHKHNTQHMGKCVQHGARQGTSGRCEGAKETMQSMKWK